MYAVFRDRREAGAKLARALEEVRNQDALVLAIPRGGVEVGYEVAKYLKSDFSIVIARKLPFPDDPEAGFGAIAEDGSIYISREAARSLPSPVIERIVEQQKAEIERRSQVLRRGRPLPEITNRTVILVDDGIAMGSTMRASIRLCKNRDAGSVIVATPVASRRVAQEIEAMVDRVVVLTQPAFFRAVAQVYQNWYDVPDAEVLAIMERWRKERAASPPASRE